MDTRKAYIVTALIIFALIAGLALWYLYLAKKEATRGQATVLDTKDYNVFTSSNSQAKQQDTTITKQNRVVTATTTTQNQATTTEPQVATTTPEKAKEESWRLVQVHNQPTVGMHPLVRAEKSFVRYVDQKTGHMFESTINLDKKRIISITSKAVAAAHFITNNTILLMHSNGNLPTIIKTDAKTPQESTVQESTMQIGIIDQSPYYLTQNNFGGMSLMSATQELWSSPLSGWVLQTLGKSATLTQAASRGIPGYAYIVHTKGGGVPQPIAQDLPGLITNASQQGTKLLYSTSDKKGTKLYLKDIATNEIINLTLTTLANKCAWGHRGVYMYCAIPSTLPLSLPDSWLKGQLHLSDTLWRINSETGDALTLAKDTQLDMVEIKESLAQNMVVFKNKQDQTLWAVIKNE